MTVLVVALAVLVGLSLGLLGGGGSILTLPLLVYVAGMETKEAIATSLLVVGVTSAVAAVSHARAGRVQWRTGLLFGAAGMAGSYAGGRLAEHVPGGALLAAFALIMLATGVAMIRGRRGGGGQGTASRMPLGQALGFGAAVGLLTGFLGAGGGFLIVPALTLLGGVAMPVAVGTSLFVIALNSTAGLAGHLSAVHLDWGLAAMVTAAAIVGSLVGGRLTGRIAPEVLRRAFGWFVLAMAAFILVKEIPPSLWQSMPALGKIATTVAAAALAFGLGIAAQRLGRRPEPVDPDAAPDPAPDAVPDAAPDQAWKGTSTSAAEHRRP